MKVLQYYAIVISVVNVSNKMQQARDIRERARAVFLVGVDIVDAGWVLFFSLAARDLKLTYLRQQFQVVVSITSRMSHNLVSKTSHEAMYFKVFAHRSQFIGMVDRVRYFM